MILQFYCNSIDVYYIFTSLKLRIFKYISLENSNCDETKYNEKSVVDTLYVKDLLEVYSKQSDLIIM